MRYLKHYFVLLLTLSFFTSCKKSPVQPVLKPGKLTSYVFTKDKNSSVLSSEIKAEIIDNEIRLNLAKEISLSTLIAKFEFEGTQVLINDQKQVSDETANDFSAPLVYKVIGEDGKAIEYKVKINIIDDSELSISSFVLDKQVNLGLLASINFEIKDNSLTATAASSDNKKYIPVFTTTAQRVLMNGKVIKSGETTVDFAQQQTLTLESSKGFRKDYSLSINWVSEIPHIYINVDGNQTIVSKDIELGAGITMNGFGRYTDLSSTRAKVRGRGNTTWSYAKKPYRIKFDSKTSMFGLPAAKKWVLLANYLDPTLMLNSIALKMGQLLNAPFTNNFVPVELTINGEYMGSYLFTEQIEVDENRVNVGKDGVLLEMDSYYDEDYKFKSTNYQLPVMVKDPELNNQDELKPIQQEFQALEDLIFASNFPNNNYLNYFDKDNLVKYLLVYTMADNEEINHPKSTYIHKTKGGKYSMGPLWDFDWAYGYEGTGKHFSSATRPLFSSSMSTKPGYKFFTRLMSDPAVKSAFKAKWIEFKANKFPSLLNFVDDYSKLIKNSKSRDYALWKKGNANSSVDFANLRQYLVDRSSYIDTYVAGF